jgi:hypothetical protein
MIPSNGGYYDYQDPNNVPGGLAKDRCGEELDRFMSSSSKSSDL